MLKQKRLVFFILVFFFVSLGVFLAIRPKAEDPVSVVRVMINGAVPRDFFSPELLEDIWQRLEAPHKTLTEPIDLKRFLRSAREEQSSIYQIQARHPDPQFSAALALRAAEALADFLYSDILRPYKARSESLDLRIQELSRLSETMAADILKLQNSLQKSDADIALERKLRQKAALYRSKAQLLKENHPDMLDLQRDIESLEAQLADAPLRDSSALETLQKTFAQTRGEQRLAEKEREDLSLKIASMGSPLKILEIRRQSRPLKPRQ